MSSLLAITAILSPPLPETSRARLRGGRAPLLAVGPTLEGDGTVSTVAEPRAPQVSRTVRVVSEVLVAGAAGTLAGALGGYLGCVGSLSVHDTCSEGTVAAGLLSGFGLAVAAGCR